MSANERLTRTKRLGTGRDASSANSPRRSEMDKTSKNLPVGLRKPWQWVQPMNRAELTQRLLEAREYAVPERERENLCSCAYEELRKKETMMDWQPIETAPKDGSSFLAWVGNWMTVAHWHRHQQCLATNGPTYERYPADEMPTHWMPLPNPPNRQGATTTEKGTT